MSYRAFFALPTSLATSTGQITNAVYGFTSMLIKLLADERPEYLAVAFDKGAPTVRLEMYADYKAGRPEAPDEFRSQIGLIREVLHTLGIPVVQVEGHEADDALATLAVRAKAEGLEAVIVTADRDFFQLVQPGISVMFNRKGISDIVRYDEAAVQERFGVPPSKYLDLVALRGDKSDNIPGVPGIGDKTATTLVQRFGSVESLMQHTDDLKGKQKENVEASLDQLVLSKDLARLQLDLDLDVAPMDCKMTPLNIPEVQHLFVTLEFRTLLERLLEVPGLATSAGAGSVAAPPDGDVATGDGQAGGDAPDELRLEQVSPAAIGKQIAAKSAKAVELLQEAGVIHGLATSEGEGVGDYAETGKKPLAVIAKALADPKAAKWVHDAKQAKTTLLRAGLTMEGVEFDTHLAGYLLDPGASEYPLARLGLTHLGTDLLASLDNADEGQLFAEPWRDAAGAAAVVALLVPVLHEALAKAGLDGLLTDVELPLSAVLAKMQARGIQLDVPYLQEMATGVQAEMDSLRRELYEHAGEEFNLNSPPQLRKILYEKLGLTPGKKTPKGELSTDASVLEKLREDHPIVDGLLRWRELDKLNSTYLEALPRMVDARDGRIHTTFNQAAAATGRLSSSNPNLQNIPVRSELGRKIRHAFVPGGQGQVLMAADYSQIELRILAHLSGDEGLRAAFEAGVDIHRATAALVFDLPLESVDVELRRRAKAVNYGLAYGMNAYGLAQRLEIAPDEAAEIMDSYFESFPSIHEYLERQVNRATTDGYTETMLGRRRYIPELTASNQRVRDMGRRMALNAPIQGSASDVFKVAMIAVDRALGEAPDLDCQMLLTVHDELVFEVAASQVEEAATLVRQAMEHAIELSVTLVADVGWGPTWAEAAPEGH